MATDPDTRICDTCGKEKPLQRFEPLGPHRRDRTCIECCEAQLEQLLREVQQLLQKVEQARLSRIRAGREAEREARGQEWLAQGWEDIGGYHEHPSEMVVSILLGLPGTLYNQEPGAQYIYALCEPHTGACRYVGRTANLQRRLRDHIRLRATDWEWLKELLHKGLEPEIRTLEAITPEQIDTRPYDRHLDVPRLRRISEESARSLSFAYQVYAMNERPDGYYMGYNKAGSYLTPKQERPHFGSWSRHYPFQYLQSR